MRKDYSFKNTPTKCGLCLQVFPSRSLLMKHKYADHNIGKLRHVAKKWTCSACGAVFLENSKLQTHNLTFHREKMFPNGPSGPKKGSKQKKEHSQKISKALRIFYGTYDPDKPLGPQEYWNPYFEDRTCTEYTKWVYEVKKRDYFRCQHCNAKDDLIAHHLLPYREFIKFRYEVSNGLTLCRSCHTKEELRLKKLRKDCSGFLLQLLLKHKDLMGNLSCLPSYKFVLIMDSAWKQGREEFRIDIQKKYNCSKEYSYRLHDTMCSDPTFYFGTI